MGCRPFRLDMWDFRAISLHGLLGARPGRHERRRRLLACRGTQPSGPCDATDCSVLAPRPRSANAAGIQRAWGVIGWCFSVSSLTSILRSGEKRWRGGNRKEGGHCGFGRVFIFSSSCHCSSLICFTTGIRQQRFCGVAFFPRHDVRHSRVLQFCTQTSPWPPPNQHPRRPRRPSRKLLRYVSPSPRLTVHHCGIDRTTSRLIGRTLILIPIPGSVAPRRCRFRSRWPEVRPQSPS